MNKRQKMIKKKPKKKKREEEMKNNNGGGGGFPSILLSFHFFLFLRFLIDHQNYPATRFY